MNCYANQKRKTTRSHVPLCEISNRRKPRISQKTNSPKEFPLKSAETQDTDDLCYNLYLNCAYLAKAKANFDWQ